MSAMTMSKSTITRRFLLALLAATPLVLAMPGSGQAASLGELLAQGKVGERYDGYVQARDGSAQGTVDQVNAKRRQLYEKRAGETGQTAEVVGKVYAAEIYKKADPGTWFLLEDGRWIQK
jgi:uncharacterized protein YdbL (DUF1318 family)